VPVTARAPRMRLVSGLKQHPGMPCQPTLPYHAAQLVTLDRAADAAALEDYTCSHSMRGVAVELVVAVRPAALVRTVTASLPSDAALPAALLRVQAPYPAASGRDHSLRAMLRQCYFGSALLVKGCARLSLELAALLARMQPQALCAVWGFEPETAPRSCARKRTMCGRPSAWTRRLWSSVGACRPATAAGPARRCGGRAVRAPQQEFGHALCQLMAGCRRACVAVTAGEAGAAVPARTSRAPCICTLHLCSHLRKRRCHC